VKLTWDVLNPWRSTDLHTAVGGDIAHAVVCLATVFTIINLPDLFNDHDEEAALVILLLLFKGHPSRLLCHLSAVLVPSGMGNGLATHLSCQLKSLAQANTGVVQALDEFRQDTVGIFVHLDRVGVQRRLALANCIDCNHSEFIVCIGSQVQSSVGEISNVVVIESEPGTSSIAAFEDVASYP